MMASRVLPILAAVVLVGAPAAIAAEEELVWGAYNAYKAAIINQDGRAGAALVAQPTVEYYEEMRKLALSAPKQRLLQEATANLMMALFMRHRVPTAELRTMSGEAVLEYGINNGWIGKDSVTLLEVGEVRIDGRTAIAQLVSPQDGDAGQFRFYKEDGGWKIDLTLIMQATSLALDSMAEDRAVTRERLILDLLSAVSGRQVGASIWDPPGETGP